MIDRSSLKLPNVSSECAGVLRLIDSPDVDMAALTTAVSRDPTLASTLIKYANSSTLGRGGVSTVKQAVTRLGLRQVRAAAMVASMRGFTSRDNPTHSLLWEQSVALSTLARAVASRCCRRLADEAELTGLIANMGAMLLATNFAAQYRDLIEDLDPGVTIHEAEREVFGLHRGELLHELAERFRLPERMLRVLGEFHGGQVPRRMENDEQSLLAVLWVALFVLWQTPLAEDWPHQFAPASVGHLQELLGLSDEDLQNIIDDAEVLVGQRMAEA